MEQPELWHVFVDNETGTRSCCYGFAEALEFNLKGELMQSCQGKTEIPVEEWTAEEFCQVITGYLEMSEMERLQNLPGIILQVMEECGAEDEKEVQVMRKILEEIMHLIM